MGQTKVQRLIKAFKKTGLEESEEIELDVLAQQTDHVREMIADCLVVWPELPNIALRSGST